MSAPTTPDHGLHVRSGVRPSPASETFKHQLSVSEVAVRLGVNVRTVRRMIARGELKAYRYGPRLIRIDPADLLAMREPVTSLAELRAGDAL